VGGRGLKILFNLTSCGLGNNGGSLTIVRSANVLQELGHEAVIIDSGKNQHTWSKLEVPHLRIQERSQIPKGDVAIATGYKTVSSTLAFPCKIRTHWIRAWETWQYQELHIYDKVLKRPTIKIVNSIGLQRKLKEYDIESYIIKPGHDFDELFPMNIRDDNKIVLGGLYHKKHKTKRSDWIFKVSEVIKTKHKNVKLHMFGADKNPHNPIIDKYIKQPNPEQKNEFFNGIDIWLTPSSLEGLHIVPQEAMLTGCAVIGTDAPLAGIEDYIINNETGLITKNRFTPFCKKVNKLVKDKELRLKLGSAGREKIISMGNRKDNMKKMVKLFEELL